VTTAPESVHLPAGLRLDRRRAGTEPAAPAETTTPCRANEPALQPCTQRVRTIFYTAPSFTEHWNTD